LAQSFSYRASRRKATKLHTFAVTSCAMFHMPLKHFAAGALCLTLARASLEEGEACDPSSGTCAAADIDGEDVLSAIQLRGGPQDQQQQQKPNKSPGQGNYWKIVDLDDVTDLMPYSKTEDDIPECFKGIAYMDQQCLTYDKMPRGTKDLKEPCLGRVSPYAWVNEYLTSFGDWNKTTKCFTALRPGWMFGQSDISAGVCRGDGIPACQDNARTHKPCDVGASYRLHMPGLMPDWFFVKTSWGWLRKTPLWLPFYTYYPVHFVVDGDGKKTEWWQDMEDEAMRSKCPPGSEKIGGPRGCRKSEWWATKQLAMCIKKTPGS